MALITLTRSVGCGGTAVAARVAEALGLELYDDKTLQARAAQLGIHEDEFKRTDENAPGLFDRLFSQKPHIYLDLLEAVVYDVAKGGRGIILGHGSQVLLRDFGCALHVRVYASESFRVKHMMEQYGLNEEKARRMMRKRDRDQRGFMEFAFHMDVGDPSLYDLVINRDKLSVDLAADLIVEAAKAPEMQEWSVTASDAMERLELLKLVQAALLRKGFNPSTMHVDVPERGLVHITAWTESKERKNNLRDAVTGIPGVHQVKLDVGVLPTGV